MAALTADRPLSKSGAGHAEEYDVAASTTIYAGALCCLDASGNLVPASDTAGLKFAGVAEEQADNSAGAAGDISVAVRTDIVVECEPGALVAADAGTVCFILDDQTVTDALAATNDVPCGLYLGDDPKTGKARVHIGHGFAYGNS